MKRRRENTQPVPSTKSRMAAVAPQRAPSPLRRSTRILQSNKRKLAHSPLQVDTVFRPVSPASSPLHTETIPPALSISTPQATFQGSSTSCLAAPEQSPALDLATRSTTYLLKRALSVDELHDESWLSSSLIDLVFTKFARCYPHVHFMPIEFAAFRLKSSNPKDNFQPVFDILGRAVDYSLEKPLVFLANQQNMHWNLLRVQFQPTRELQLFEPLGKPASRHSVSFRYVPKHVVHWLDTCYPCEDSSWLKKACSAITVQHQFTGFDCGVACLLYSEKCGQGHSKEMINESTTQADITQYRQWVQNYIRFLQVSTPTAQEDPLL